MNPKVIILGGGVAGLSAAHELIERNFDVEVHELLPIPGGKARSFGVPGTGRGGRKDLPGEHGFRFFPRFYRHVTETMKRIPYGAGGCVADNLVDTTRFQLNRYGRFPIDVIARSPRTITDVRAALDGVSRFLNGDLDLSHDDLRFFGSKVWQIVTSCRRKVGFCAQRFRITSALRSSGDRLCISPAGATVSANEMENAIFRLSINRSRK